MAAKKKTGTKKPKAGDGAILITGASGFLGKHLVAILRGADGSVSKTDAKRPIRALVRSPSLHLERHGVEVVMGSVCSADDCARAMEGVTEVYHLAGKVSRAGEDSALFKLHVEGTRTVLEAAKRAGVRRVVVVSTSGTIAVTPNSGEVSNEESGYRLDTVARWPYYLSKIYQEKAAFQLASELDLDVVVVNPSLLIGPGDDRGSSTGDVEKVVRGKLPIMPKSGGVAFVDVRDAALGCVRAMERGRSGERYLLSAENISLERFLGRVARIAGVSSPRPWVSPRAMRFAAGLLESIYRRVDAVPPIDAHSLEMAEHTWYCDNSKARAELGFEPRDSQVSLVDTVRDIQRRHNLLPPGAKAEATRA